MIPDFLKVIENRLPNSHLTIAYIREHNVFIVVLVLSVYRNNQLLLLLVNGHTVSVGTPKLFHAERSTVLSL